MRQQRLELEGCICTTARSAVRADKCQQFTTSHMDGANITNAAHPFDLPTDADRLPRELQQQLQCKLCTSTKRERIAAVADCLTSLISCTETVNGNLLAGLRERPSHTAGWT